MEKINAEHYSYRVTWSEEDGEFVAQCAEFNNLSHLAAKSADALRGITELVRGVVDDMQSVGETPPLPFSQRPYSGKFMLRLPPETHRRLSIEAAEQNVSLNRLVAAKL
ncbi:MAG: toxin-antitoxin system HicB family antitoxin [Alphaproteobacteria bacterium]|nr:toxin-antitoxin system HicB family antitoxin [Alphaproteobacteria bacterium]